MAKKEKKGLGRGLGALFGDDIGTIAAAREVREAERGSAGVESGESTG